MTAAIAIQSTGRHRRDGRRPSGKSRTRTISDATARFCVLLPSALTGRTAGSEPGAVARPRRPYCSRNMLTASSSPSRVSSQPIALPGTRAAISPPIAGVDDDRDRGEAVRADLGGGHHPRVERE